MNANNASGLKESRINSKPVGPKPEAFVPSKHHRFAGLQRRDGETMRGEVSGLNRAVESWSM